VPHVRLLQELVKRLRGHLCGVGSIANSFDGRFVVQQPSHVRPPKAFIRRVWVFRSIAVLMMISVRRRPLDRVALDRQRAAIRQRVLQPFRRLKRLVRQLPVVTQRDSQAPGDEIHDHKAVERLPGEVKRRQQRANVHGANKRHVRYIRPQPLSHKRVLFRTGDNIGQKHLMRWFHPFPRAFRRRRGFAVHRRPNLRRFLHPFLANSLPRSEKGLLLVG